MATYEITIRDLPTSVNMIWRRGKNNVTYKTTLGKKWQHDTCMLYKKEIPERHLDHIWLSVDIYYKDLRRRDNSNYLKLLEDALVDAQIIFDDNWKHLSYNHIQGHLDRGNPRIELTISTDK